MTRFTAASTHPPRTRADCTQGPRPCPFLLCRHHLNPRDELRPKTPDVLASAKHANQATETCALDVADRRRPLSVETVAVMLNVHPEVVRRIEARALRKLRAHGVVLTPIEAKEPRSP